MKKKENEPVVHYDARYLWRPLRPRKGRGIA
jgi:hypothetical protein